MGVFQYFGFLMMFVFFMISFHVFVDGLFRIKDEMRMLREHLEKTNTKGE